jgi:hypothetical protein
MGDYDDDERPSWREIDKKRDRSSHVTQERAEKKEGPKDRWRAGRQKQALDRLFLGEKGTIEHEKLYNKIHKTYGTDRFPLNVQNYIVKYGPPDDASTLVLIIDTKVKEIILQAIEKLRTVYDKLTPREKEDVRRKISIVAMTERAADVKELAREVIEELKGKG